jgi:UDP-N-acetylmuramoyl-tripeptide--D-alanyl-D-alanine ligase
LCELVQPQAAIITAIGVMHLERFGSQEQIYRAKTELAAAIPDNGILVCNGDDPNTRRAASQFTKQTTLLYGFDTSAKLDCWMTELKVSPEGTKFTLHWQNRSYQGQTALLGRPALSNLMAAICTTCALGADPQVVIAAASNLRPVENRLSIEKTSKTLYLKDAYNSNPIGFTSALEVLQELQAKRRILVTPGMVELGELQYSENKRIAVEAAKVCDLVLLVGETNRPAWQEGLVTGGLEEYKVLNFESRDQALNKLVALEQAGDVVLIENDLADWYEDKAKF